MTVAHVRVATMVDPALSVFVKMVMEVMAVTVAVVTDVHLAWMEILLRPGLGAKGWGVNRMNPRQALVAEGRLGRVNQVVLWVPCLLFCCRHSLLLRRLVRMKESEAVAEMLELKAVLVVSRHSPPHYHPLSPSFRGPLA